LPKTNFSDIDPLQSIGNVTAPLDKIFEAIGGKINLDSINLPKTLKSGPEARSNLKEILGDLSAQEVLGMARGAFIFVANIFIVILEVVLSIVRGILGLIT